MQKQISDAPTASAARYALGGVVLAFVAGLFVAQAGASDRETFLPIGLIYGAAGLLCIIIGGVAIGIHLARD